MCLAFYWLSAYDTVGHQREKVSDGFVWRLYCSFHTAVWQDSRKGEETSACKINNQFSIAWKYSENLCIPKDQKYKLLDYAQLCKITNVQLLIKRHACRSCTVSYKSVSPRHTPSIIPTARTPGPYYITVSAHFHFHVIHLLYQTQKVDL